MDRDLEAAASYFRAAADQGLANAQLNLGWLYEQGEGVLQSAEEAGYWYGLAAEQGEVAALERLEILNPPLDRERVPERE